MGIGVNNGFIMSLTLFKSSVCHTGTGIVLNIHNLSLLYETPLIYTWLAQKYLSLV